MTKHISIEERRQNRLRDAHILFYKHKIDMPEYHRLVDMIRSPDEENLTIAAELIKALFRKPKKIE